MLQQNKGLWNLQMQEQMMANLLDTDNASLVDLGTFLQILHFQWIHCDQLVLSPPGKRMKRFFL